MNILANLKTKYPRFIIKHSILMSIYCSIFLISLSSCIIENTGPEIIALRLEQTGNGEVTLSWELSQRAVSYSVCRYNFNDELERPMPSLVLNNTSVFVDNQNLAPGQRVHYKITGYGQHYNDGAYPVYAWSNTETISLSYLTPEPDTVPVPLNSRVSLQQGNTILLSWDSVDAATTYDVLYSTTPISNAPSVSYFSYLNPGPISDTLFSYQANLATSNEYIYYRVIAYDAAMKASIPSPPIRVRFP